MCNRDTAEKVIIVTTSWDDGHSLDVRLAELLDKYGLRGTFYVPLRHEGHAVMSNNEICYIQKKGMEIGAHTLTHPVLTKLHPTSLIKELTKGKELLEDILGKPVLSFCYPKGKFNNVVRSLVIEAGYKLARTTVSFRMERNFDPFCMPVTFQLFPHGFAVHIKHALKYLNLKGIANWFEVLKMESNLVSLSNMAFNHVLQHGGVFHVWGHTWEIEQTGLWNLFEEILEHIANRQGVYYLTNLQTLDMVNQSQSLPTTWG